MIDIHCHLLPGIDDGAPTLDDTRRMVAMAAADGCTAMIATPHQRHPEWENNDPASLRRKLARVREAVVPATKSDPPEPAPPELHLGAEIRIDPGLLDDLESSDHGGLVSLAGSRYLLLEFDRSLRPPVDPPDLIHELRVAGWLPILAHPEFVPWLVEDLGRVAELVDRGAYFQLTAASLLGVAGRGPASVCRELLDADLVHFVASDAHGVTRRPPGLARAYEHIAARWSVERADRLLRANPAAVLADLPLTTRERRAS